MDNNKKEMCTMQIMFPVDSDQEAIDYKQKISEALKDKTEAQIRFSLMSSPGVPGVGSQVQ